MAKKPKDIWGQPRNPDYTGSLADYKESTKKEKLYGQELGKIGRAAERGGPVNKVQKEHGEYSEQVMYANKMKNMPFKRKLEELGLQLTVSAALNPKTFETTANLAKSAPKVIKQTFTGNPITNIKDSATRLRMIEENVRQGNLAAQMPIREAEVKMAQQAENLKMSARSSDPKVYSQQKNYYDSYKAWEKELEVRKNNPASAPEAIRSRATKTANEDMALIQTNRAMKKALDKVIKEESKKITKRR